MKLDFVFFLNSIMLGIGLAMDAFSVSMANGLNEPKMKKGKMFGVAGIFGAFQGVMPLIGWICVHSFVTRFEAFSKYIPWIALVLLCFIGGKMLYDSFKGTEENEKAEVGLAALLVQAVATSIDALSVGFTIAEYDFKSAFVCVLVIALVTFAICFIGIEIGKKFGTKLSNKAQILGGVILILIGIEIFISGII